MAYSEAANKAAQRYKKEKIKRVPLDMQIDEYERVKAAAEAQGEKVNQYIKEAIRLRIAGQTGERPGGSFGIPCPPVGE